ncbi:MAG TPA: glycoside hydrolase family 2 TIM barrel-domain containing protein [Candidatus Dormibacteraeota bacterium]|nr:glycoside hydrolase family 2 TIM barrel-domain containing protein [Candidatus Dormibacteraeota bacterium]
MSPEYPRPTFRRDRWITLNGPWDFGAGDSEAFDRRITVPFCPQSRLSGLDDRDPGDTVWYRRRFDAPEAERLLLHFGAVDYRATVWVDGEEVARHEGGHTPFSADISHVAGRRDNLLVVRADDPLADKTIPRGKQHWKRDPEGIFYTATTGIWQTVWLEPIPARSIQALRVTPHLDAGTVDVVITADGDVEAIAAFHGVEVGRRKGSGPIQLSTIRPWSPESPDLYELRVSLLDAHGRELDVVHSYFGLRKIEAREGRFWLNGAPYVQRLVLDQGYFPAGLMTAPSDAALRRDILQAKAMGFNGARKHQKVEDPRWLYWADRLGFLVWGEMADFHEDSPDARRRLKDEWSAAVLRDRDHPSIVAWVPVNESFGLGEHPAEFLDDLYRLTRELDPTRLVVSNDGWEHATSDLCTLHDYAPAAELAARYRRLDTALAPREHPVYLSGYAYHGEPMVVSEFGGVSLAGSGGFGYSQARGAAGLLDAYREMVEALMAPGPVEGFCYTQLADVEQERNGLLTDARRPKIDPELLRPFTQAPKRR